MSTHATDTEIKMVVMESQWGWGDVDQRLALPQTRGIGRVAFLSQALLHSVTDMVVWMARVDCHLGRIQNHLRDKSQTKSVRDYIDKVS